MTTKAQQLRKLTKIRAALVKYRLTVKNVNPILENLLNRDKPLLKANLLRDIESMLQDRVYLKSSRLSTAETDREICHLLEDLYTAFSSGIPVTTATIHDKRSSICKTQRPAKRTKGTAGAGICVSKRPPKPQKLAKTRQHAPKTMSAAENASPTRLTYPLTSASLRGKTFERKNGYFSLELQVGLQGQRFWVHDMYRKFEDNTPGFLFFPTELRTIQESRPRVFVKTSDETEITLHFSNVHDIERFRRAISEFGSKVEWEDIQPSSKVDLMMDDSEHDAFTKVKVEANRRTSSDKAMSRKGRGTRPSLHVNSYEDDDEDDDDDDSDGDSDSDNEAEDEEWLPVPAH